MSLFLNNLLGGNPHNHILDYHNLWYIWLTIFLLFN